METVTHCHACGWVLGLQSPRSSRQERYYRPMQLLGQGGFGRTWLAQMVSTPHQPPQTPSVDLSPREINLRGINLCVIKQLLQVDAQRMALFHQEAQRLQELGDHPQIPSLIDAFEQGQQLYLIQEYISGLNLDQLLAEQGCFSESQIWTLLTDLLPVLDFVHTHQVIHRDIKPANLIWHIPPVPAKAESPGKWVLVDFGAAKRVSAAPLNPVGTVIGSAEYVAPEQARGKAVFASDLYSLGVTCIHALTGYSPFDLFDGATGGWAWSAYVSPPVSSALTYLLDRLLTTALSRRFVSATAVLKTMPQRGQGIATAVMTRELTHAHHWICDSVWTGHLGSVNTVAFSLDGHYGVSGGEDKTIRLWDGGTGTPVAVFKGHTQALRSVVCLPDYPSLGLPLMASASQDKTIRLWAGSDPSPRLTLTGHQQWVTALAPVTLAPVPSLEQAELADRADWLISGSWDKTLCIWQMPTGELLSTISSHRLPITALAFQATEQFGGIGLLVSGSCDRTAQVYGVSHQNSGLVLELRHTLAGHDGAVMAVAISSTGEWIATGGDDRLIRLWSASTGRLVQTWSGHSWSVVALAFLPGDQTLVSGSWDGTVKLWDLTPQPMRPKPSTLVGHTDAVTAIAVSSDGQMIVSASRDGTLRCWRQRW